MQKYKSVVEIAAEEAFKKEIERILSRIIFAVHTCRTKGILEVDNIIDYGKAASGEPLEVGLKMAVDAYCSKEIEQYFDSWIAANCSNRCEYYDMILLLAIKIGILGFQAGTNPKTIDALIRSTVPLELMPPSLEELDEKI